MFSSVLDKVVSATAPDILASFPPREDLPASSSTLCCLSLADRFISHYPTALVTTADGGIDHGLLLDRVEPPAGIALSIDDLESAMENAAELGGRLAAALAGTVRSKRRDAATAPVPDLLAKVRGIFGNRLTCVGREIRVLRNVQEERDETLLLRQIHALKNAVLDACNAEKWCIVVSSGGESLVVCSIPLPPVEKGEAWGCDFLIFDPWPRPAMKLRGSYIVKFTTVRGLQLHLLSALGEIWREKGSQEDGVKKEFVGLSVVMEAKATGGELLDVDARRKLEDSVTSLRKAEKAAAIKKKREEVEALRKALEKSEQAKQPIRNAPAAGGILGSIDNAREHRQSEKINDRQGESNSSPGDAQSYRRLLPPEAIIGRCDHRVEAPTHCDGDTERQQVEGGAGDSYLACADTELNKQLNGVDGRHFAVEAEQKPLESPAPRHGLSEKSSQSDHQYFSVSRSSSGGRSQLRLPVAAVSPPLASQRSGRGDGQRRSSADDEEEFSLDGQHYRALGGTNRMVGTGEVVNASSSVREEIKPLASREGNAGGDERRAEQCRENTSASGSNCPSGRPVEVAILDNPLHRALLRSVEGEGLAEYSQRAYNIYRTHGVIEDEAEPGHSRARGLAAHDYSLSVNQLFPRHSVSPLGLPATFMHGSSSGKVGPANSTAEERLERKDCDPVGLSELEPVMPFSPPPASPQQLRRSEKVEQSLSSDHRKSVDTTPGPTTFRKLRVADFSEAEDVAKHKPDRPESPSESFRSRLRAPRAGRALALASANARGKRGCRRAEAAPGVRRDMTGSEFLPQPPPPPPPAMTTGNHAQPREAWTEESGGIEPERPCPTLGAGAALNVSDEDEDGDGDGVEDEHEDENEDDDEDEDRNAVRSGAVPRKAVAPTEGRGEKCRPARLHGNSKQRRGDEHEHLSAEPWVRLDGDTEGGSQGGVTAPGLQKQSQGAPEPGSDGEHLSEEEASIGRPIDGSTDNGRHDAIVFAAPGNSTLDQAPSTSPQLKISSRLAPEDHHRSQRDVQSNGPYVGEKAASELFVIPGLPVEPQMMNPGAQGLHRRSEYETTGEGSPARESFPVDEKAPDNDDFVWFGQPDATPRQQTGEDVERKEVVAAEGGELAWTAIESAIGRSYLQHRRHRSKAQLILQMWVRRQRAIIERAFQARQEESRLRRARVGAEVFKRMQELRRGRRSVNPSQPPNTSSNSGRVEQPPTAALVPLARSDATRRPQADSSSGEATAAASPPHAEKNVGAWGIPPAAAVENTVTAVQPELLLVPGVTPPEISFIAVGEAPLADKAFSEPPTERTLRAAAAVDNPWRRVISLQHPEHESGSKAKLESIPPPIRFEVETDALQDGAGEVEGGANQEQEKARRQERFEALRARKMLEADQRRRDRKARQAAAGELKRRRSAAAAAGAEKEKYDPQARSEPRRQDLSRHSFADADATSKRSNGQPPGMSAVRARSPTLARDEDGRNASQGVSALGDSNGSGGGKARPPAPGVGRVASSAVRGFSRRSNRKLVRNAINFLCLAGGHLEKKKARVLEALDAHPASNFVLLLAHTKLLSFKGLYACSADEDGTADRVFGLGPPQVDATMASGFYKYNSAAREFHEVHSKTLGKTTDAVSMEPMKLRRPKGLVMP